jgi:acyl-CoA reductase-like NAD-dependent aldehyde dehydrogenase
VTEPQDRFRLWIGGEPAVAAKGSYEIVNPATEEVVGLAPEASADDAREAASAAASAFPAWSQTTPDHRAALLNRAAHLLERRSEEFISWSRRRPARPLPFGGFKKSGVGRDGGSFALQAYTELQSIVWPG